MQLRKKKFYNIGLEHPLHSGRGEADRPVRLPHPGRRHRDEAGVNVIKRSSFVSDTQHNDTQYNATQYNDTKYNDIQHNDTHCNAIKHNDTQHNATQHNSTQHNSTQHNAI